MHYSLTHDDDNYFGDALHKIVHLAPCFVFNAPDLMKLYFDHTVAEF